MLSVRRTLTAGVAAGLVVVAAGAAAVSAPVAPPALPVLPSVAAPAVQLSAAVSALPQPAAALPTPPVPVVIPSADSAGDWIINGYNLIQPWVEYGVSLSAWAVGWLPWPIGLIGPQANILYSGWQPIGQSLAYSAAYLLDRQFQLIVPTLVNGLKTGVSNLVWGEIQWVLSFFPPLPPIRFPVPPGAATPARSAATMPPVAATVSTEQAGSGPEAPVAADSAATAADPAPAPQAAPTRRAARPLGRGTARAQRPVPAPSAAAPAPAAASEVAAGEAPRAGSVFTVATKSDQKPTPPGSTRAGKAKAGSAAGRSLAEKRSRSPVTATADGSWSARRG